MKKQLRQTGSGECPIQHSLSQITVPKKALQQPMPVCSLFYTGENKCLRK